MAEQLAPVLLFTYCRLRTLQEAVSALLRNRLARQSELIVFSDGPKNDLDYQRVEEVREYLRNINGFKDIQIREAKCNLGLAKSIINGVSSVLNSHAQVIVLEDDLVCSENFLDFMNSALGYYKNSKLIYSISGYSPKISKPGHDVYFTQRASSWGWATWSDRWASIQWNMEMSNLSADVKKDFNRMGSDLSKMLDDYMRGKINSWAIRWVFHQYKTGSYTVFPSSSKISNIGIGGFATNTHGSRSRYETYLDKSNKYDFTFRDTPVLEKYYLEQFLKPYSLSTRIIDRLHTIISR